MAETGTREDGRTPGDGDLLRPAPDGAVAGHPADASPQDRSPQDGSPAGDGERRRPGIGEGPGRLIVSLYGLFTVAAGSRSIYQLIAQYDRAPLAYLLSAVAAVVYAFILVTLVRGGESARRIGIACCALELAGVLVVGTLTIVTPSLFHDQTVWSYYGADYLFIPLVLPITGILWLRRAGAATTAA
ncbi:hypothetical protein [Streptantibioticus silvisoli]|uniref:hypothetical protein n=1 Tax=Streptantibioticus silvisoli TaxID=2705255 RepID=UPI0027E2881D|nr:hypothetical protein [Streptantibioticus silvisoli]